MMRSSAQAFSVPHTLCRSSTRAYATAQGSVNPKLVIAAAALGFLSLIALVLTHTSTYNVSLIRMSSQQDRVQSGGIQATAQRPQGSATIPDAAKALIRISQNDPSQYSSSTEFATWAGSACSTTAMTEVLNAWGSHERITNVLAAEITAHAISTDAGLLDEAGISATMASFGFTTEWGHSWSLDDIIAIANVGFPVIVSLPPPAWGNGHIIIVRGGNSQDVLIADSSAYNYQAFTRATFLSEWRGFAAIALPTSTNDFRQFATQDAQQAGISPTTFVRQINQESGFLPFVVSYAGAIGIAQFMPATATGVGLNPWNPTASLGAAALYMAQHLAQYHGDYQKALASYNAGEGAVNAAMQAYGDNWLAYMPQETQNYVAAILG